MGVLLFTRTTSKSSSGSHCTSVISPGVSLRATQRLIASCCLMGEREVSAKRDAVRRSRGLSKQAQLFARARRRLE
jgi:hypothetical protein